jgi:2-dehydro-3-deoxyphosphooctonate aldolase (KDO 8-P synthase)
MNKKSIKIGGLQISQEGPLFLIAGPCVIENERITMEIAEFLKGIQDTLGIGVIFKASYDKANRTSIDSFRGPGIEKGLELLNRVKRDYGLPILSDVHRISEVRMASDFLDVIQIPAFLCRQTDLITSVARTGIPMNIKKGQFLSPWDMEQVIRKAEFCGNTNLILTERGTSFGYNNLVFDVRSIPIMRSFGYPVVFDATHSVQLPGGKGSTSGGQREFAQFLARAAVAAGEDGVFMEIHPDPDSALCDGANSLPLDHARELIRILNDIHGMVHS